MDIIYWIQIKNYVAKASTLRQDCETCSCVNLWASRGQSIANRHSRKCIALRYLLIISCCIHCLASFMQSCGSSCGCFFLRILLQEILQKRKNWCRWWENTEHFSMQSMIDTNVSRYFSPTTSSTFCLCFSLDLSLNFTLSGSTCLQKHMAHTYICIYVSAYESECIHIMGAECIRERDWIF